jgi:hypothetical protein
LLAEDCITILPHVNESALLTSKSNRDATSSTDSANETRATSLRNQCWIPIVFLNSHPAMRSFAAMHGIRRYLPQLSVPLIDGAALRMEWGDWFAQPSQAKKAKCGVFDEHRRRCKQDCHHIEDLGGGRS